MFLSDPMIVDAVRKKDIIIVTPAGEQVIVPDQPPPAELEAHGYNMRVNKVICLRTGKEIELSKTYTHRLRPGEQALLETYERIGLKNHITGTVHSLARLYLGGLSPTSTTIHPGWGMPPHKPAPLRVPVVNYFNFPIDINYLDPICRIIFYQATKGATAPAPSPEEVFVRQMANVQPVRNRYEQRRKRKRLVVVVAVAIFLFVVFYGLLYIEPQIFGYFGPAFGAIIGAIVGALIAPLIQDLRG